MPLVRISACGPLTIEVLREVRPDPQAEGGYQLSYGPPAASLLRRKGISTALTLLRLLISQPNGFAARDWLMEKLRRSSQRGDELTGGGLIRLDNIVSLLRGLLCPPGMPGEEVLRKHLLAYVHTSGESGGGYRLAGAPLLWLDVEALAAHVRQVRQLERSGQAAQADWEAVYHLGMRGHFLPEELYSDWAARRREEVESLLWQSVQVLWRRALAHHEETEALRLLQEYWYEHIEHEEALRPLLELLGQHGEVQRAEQYYARLCAALDKLGQEPDPRTQAIMTSLRERQRQQHTHNAEQGLAFPNAPRPPSLHQQPYDLLPPLPHSTALTAKERGQENLPIDVSRRHLLQQASYMGRAALTLSSDELLERFQRAMMPSASIDATTLNYLETRTQHYWHDRQSAVVASCDLLSYVRDQFEKVVTLLEKPLLPAMRRQLCALASKTAQLVGELLLDMSEYTQARNYHEAAILAAQEAQHVSLEAIAWGRISLVWTYLGQKQQALLSVQKARHVAMRSAHPLVKNWLAAIEAEALANLGDPNACLRALDEAVCSDTQQSAPEELYLIRFDSSLFKGYQGACFQQLSHLEEKQSHLFLRKAQSILLEALAELDSTVIHRQPTFLTDLADTYFQQGELEEACARAMEAGTVAAQVKLQKVMRCLLHLQHHMEPWKNLPAVQSLGTHLSLLVGHEVP